MNNDANNRDANNDDNCSILLKCPVNLLNFSTF